MLLIDCPFCGPRAETEFTYGGPAVSRRPDAPQDMTDADWVAHLTIVPNPLGPVREKWWHARGCGQWLELERSTLTHDITDPPNATR